MDSRLSIKSCGSRPAQPALTDASRPTTGGRQLLQQQSHHTRRERTTGDKLDIHRAAADLRPRASLGVLHCTVTSDQGAMRLVDAGDGSAWSAATRNSTYFRESSPGFRLRRRVLDTRGNIVLYPRARTPTSVPTSDRAANPICVTPTLKRWAPTPSTLPGLPTSSRISLNSACRPRGWWHRSRSRRQNSGRFWRCRLPIDKINKIDLEKGNGKQLAWVVGRKNLSRRSGQSDAVRFSIFTGEPPESR